MNPKKIFISACEVSGDMHGAALAMALLNQDASLELVGVGGPKMKAAGVTLIADITATSTIGLIEPIRYLPRILMAYFKVKSWLKAHPVSDFVAIDAQGFHLLILNWIRCQKIRTHYYIAPQEWQWGTEAGGRKVARTVDHILAIFKPEADFYTRLGAQVTYVGHPLLDTTQRTIDKSTFCARYGLDPHRPILGLFPGSRRQELRLAAPDLLRAAALIGVQRSDVQVVVSCAAAHNEPALRQLMAQFKINGPLVFGSLELMSVATASLTVSGTITLEHAILGVPCVVGYRFGAASYWIAKTFFAQKIARLPYMALPNLLMKREIYPEFFQDQLIPEKMAEKMLEILAPHSKLYADMVENLQPIKSLLGEPGVLDRVAYAILSR